MQLPRDLFAHDDLENEWWYYHGHLFSGELCFGFHWAYFRRRTDLLRIGGWIPVRLASKQIRFGQFALTDRTSGVFRYGHRRSLIGNAGAAADQYELWIRDWHVKASEGGHHLRVSIRDAEMDVTLIPRKPVALHGEQGLISKAKGQTSHYFSYPRLDVEGRLTIEGRVHQVRGDAWLDREYGPFSFGELLHGWDWFGIQLDDGRDLMIYHIRDRSHRPTDCSFAALIHQDGAVEQFGAEDFRVAALSSWTSPGSQITYPLVWRIQMDRIEADLRIEPYLRCHEMDTRGSTNLLYWEGPASVVGTLGTQDVSGRCYTELVGYEHAPKRLGLFDFSTNNLALWGFLTNELRLRAFGPGVRLSDEDHAGA